MGFIRHFITLASMNNIFKKRWIFILLLITGCSGKEGSAPSEKSTDTMQAVAAETKNERPLMTLTLADGSLIEARDLEEPMLLIFFQPDCDHCQNEAKQIRQKLDEFRDYKLYFISSHPMDVIRKFAADYKLNDQPNVHFGYATVESVLNNYGPISAPSVYIYSRDGRLVESFDGEVDVGVIIKYL